MNRGVVKFRFWGKNWLQSMGAALGGGFLFLAVYVIGSRDFSGGVGRMLLDSFQVYPVYVFLVGTFVMAMYGVTWFQTYYSVFVSLSATRREAVVGIVVAEGAVAAGLAGFMAAFWAVIPGGGKYLSMMPLVTGILFVVASFAMVLGVAIVRWKKLGVLLAVILYGSCGMAFGITLAMTGDDSGAFRKLQVFDGTALWPVLLAGAGVLLYLLSCVFAVVAMRRSEVRV